MAQTRRIHAWRWHQSGIVAPGAPAIVAASRVTAVRIVRSLRPDRWIQNLIVFAGLLFGGRILEPESVWRAAVTFAIFCGLSSALYLLNDISDRDTDRRHPLKRMRPLASERLAPRAALVATAVIIAAVLAAAVWVRPMLVFAAASYFALGVLYSLTLRHVVIVDVLAIACSFVIRAAAGAIALTVPIDHWLLVCTTLLALFLALSKRRHELTLPAERAADHRRVLGEYSPYLLDQMLAIVGASVLLAYCVYTISPDTTTKVGAPTLGLTIPFVLYGILRYLYLVHQRFGGGNAAAILLADRPLLACVMLWALSITLILYARAFGWRYS